MKNINEKLKHKIYNILKGGCKWALNQIDESRLGERLKNNVMQWLDGTKTPTFNQIEDFSKKTNIPLGYFFLKTPPIEHFDLLEYRIVDSIQLANPSRDLIDTIQEMERVQEWMKEYRQDTGFDKLPVVGSMGNNADSGGAKLFSLCHEMAHIWLGENDFYNDQRNPGVPVRQTEVICNAVAGELLVPGDAFVNEWEKTKEEDIFDKIKDIARVFKCGESVIARKALDAKKIDQTIYDKVVKNAIEAFRNQTRSGGGDYYNTMKMRLDGCFVRALSESIKSGRTTYTEAFRLTNTNRRTFLQVVAEFGGVE